jgi:hypothetical protein
MSSNESCRLRRRFLLADLVDQLLEVGGTNRQPRLRLGIVVGPSMLLAIGDDDRVAMESQFDTSTIAAAVAALCAVLDLVD